MTSIPISVGLGNTEKTSSKVLKPPGGGCSGIFDTAPPAPKAQPAAAPPPAASAPPPAAAAPAPAAPPPAAAAPPPAAAAPPPAAAAPPPAAAAPPPAAAAPPPAAAAPPPAATAPPPAAAASAAQESLNNAPVAAGLRSERQKLFGPAETSSEVHKQSYNYRNQSSIVFGGVDSTASEPGKAASTHQPCVRIHNPPGGKSSGIF